MRLVRDGAGMLSRGLAAGALLLCGEAAWGGAVRASLVSDRAVVTAGEVFTLAVVFEIEPGWNTYWRNPGDSGAPPRIELTLPAGWEWGGMGAVEWPHPKRKVLPGGIVDYVYEGRVALMAPVLVGDGESGEASREIVAAVEWLECDDDRCVPGSAELRLEMRTGGESVVGEGAGLIGAQRLKTARAWGSGEVSASWEGEWLVIRVGGSEVREMRYFPYSEGDGSLMPSEEGERDWRSAGNSLRVRFEGAGIAAGGEALGNLVVDRASGEREVWEVRARAGEGE